MRCFVVFVAFIAVSIPCLAQTTAPIEQRPRTPVTVPDTVALEANIPYDQYADTVLDIMYPKEPSKEKRPCVVVFHGGGWVHSDKESTMSALCLPCAINPLGSLVTHELSVRAQFYHTAAVEHD